MNAQEFINKINSNEAQILNLEAARSLKGKRITTFFHGYAGNYNEPRTFVVGDVVSLYDYEKTQPMEGYNSRADYWDAKLPNRAKEAKEQMQLLTADGENTYIFAQAGEDVFVCSDADRVVYFILAE